MSAVEHRIQIRTAGGKPLPLDKIDCTVYIYDAFDNLGEEYSRRPIRILPDLLFDSGRLGEHRAVTGPSGQIVARQDYEPSGNEISFESSSPRSVIAG